MSEARPMAELAAALYGESAPPPVPVSSVATPDAELAACMYPTQQVPDEVLPDGVREARDADPARALYDDAKTYRYALDAAFQGIESSPEAAAERKAWAGVLADAQVSAVEAEGLASFAQHAYPSEATAAGWVSTAMADLEREFGDAQAALADARLLVQRDPRLQRVLNQTGLGDHPRIVLKAAQAARRLIAAGKLHRR